MTTKNQTVQKSKRHHVIPKMILKNFSTSDGSLHAYNRLEARHFKVMPNNVFVQKHRNTQFGAENDESRLEVEDILEKIETAATGIIKRIVRLAKIGLVPPLSREEGEIVTRFLIMFFLRTDHYADEIVPMDRYDRDFRSEGFRLAEKHGLDVSEWEEFQDSQVFSEIIRESWHDLRARVAGGLPPQIADQIESFIREYGLSISMTDGGATGFIVGDCGGVRVVHPEKADVFHSWLPVSREVVIGLTSHPDDVTYENLERKYVNSINWTTFEASDIVVAKCKSDLDYVVRRWEDSQDRT